MASLSINTVQSTLKACVISNAEGVEESRLNFEFRQLMGCSIPFRELGFKSTQDLIKSLDDLKVVTKGDRRMVVARETSVEHLSSMIKAQKKSSSSSKKRSSQRFNQIKSNAFKYNDYYGSGNYKSGLPPSGKGSSKKFDFIERNNNLPVKSQSQKEVHHNSYSRPAGDSSSSGNSSPTLILTTDLKPSSKQSQQKQKSRKPPKKDEQNRSNKQPPPKTKTASLSHNKDVQRNSAKQSGQVTPTEVKSDIKTFETFKTKQVPSLWDRSSPPEPSLFQTTATPFSPQTSVNKPSPERIKSPPQTPQLYQTSSTDVAPTEPVNFSPITLQNSFVPDNLVPPKPMKPGSYRGSGRKLSSKNKLMSFKDNSTPGKDSLTAKFVNLIKAQEWPEPEYRLLPRLGPNKVEVYGCTVCGYYSLDGSEALLTYDYSTIPDEFSDTIASKEAVSKKAFEDISNKIREARNYIPGTSNLDDIIERIYDVVTPFPNGLWAYKVESDYTAKYGERLPKNWVDLVSNTDILIAEKLADFSYVIRPVIMDKIEIMSKSEMPLGELEYPDTENWDIFVTKIVSSTDVWFRFVGHNYSDWMDEVTKEMYDYYNDYTPYICPSPEVGGIYVYPSIYGAVRVKVISLETPDMATVMHIDHGDIEEIPREQLCLLDNKFRKLPAQAVCCKMYDLEEYSSSKMCYAFLIDKVEGAVLVAEIVQTEPLVLIMFDTSLDDPINLNQDVVNCLKIDLTTPPSFSMKSVIQEAVVTSIWKTGEIFLQLPNDGLTHLSYHLDSIQEMPPDNYLKYPEEVFPDVLYMVSVGGVWLRATIFPPARPIDGMVELLLVDTGDIETSLYTELVPLSHISMVLSEIPRQAVRVKLSNVNMYEELVEKLQSLVVPPCNAIIKVINLDQEPKVELYLREPKGLISINYTLSVEESLSKKVNNMSLNTSRTDFSTIMQAETPNYGEFFDVYVVSVSNPSNFTVIPRKYIKELSNLQNDLQEFYNLADAASHKLRNFSIGQACAVQHSDGHWYRGLIDRVIDQSMSQFMIRFCDFGNFAMISADRLLALDRSFIQLPALGFNASIADIKPISGDWEFVDCIRTQKLMLEKNLVTVIKSKTKDQEQTTLKLQVFDTTDQVDCDIGSTLVEESRAVYI